MKVIRRSETAEITDSDTWIVIVHERRKNGELYLSIQYTYDIKKATQFDLYVQAGKVIDLVLKDPGFYRIETV